MPPQIEGNMDKIDKDMEDFTKVLEYTKKELNGHFRIEKYNK